MEQASAQIIYLPHGGGPMPILGGHGHEALTKFLRELPGKLRVPQKILIISAHWEEKEVTITSGPSPEMIYDYYGFPEEAYKFNYPAPGDSECAALLQNSLKEQNINATLDDKRGFDHGMYIPLMLMYPDATIPCVQVSLLKNLDPKQHYDLGVALAKTLTEDVLVIGSGMSFHNMKAFGEGASKTEAHEFADWLADTCANSTLESEEVKERLIDWSKAPQARFCHPREEHLIPLHVCQGMAEALCLDGKLVFDDEVLGQRCQAFMWG